MTKAKTMNLKGNEYAKVSERVKIFRSENPRGDIKTEPIFQGENIVFKTQIIRDKAMPNSASATGHAIGKLGQQKAFEKLETISVGRALALLGYSADGEIASAEEMQEFEAHRKTQQEDTAKKIMKMIKNAKTLADLAKVWKDNQPLPSMYQEEITALKDQKKSEYAAN